ncbi:MAG: hypothetical protein JXR94_24545 [Candidatus Hydrogenedentes bacterium]|nr:hypothetical protein [Candidatus Hydrogenedentota bacterium]
MHSTSASTSGRLPARHEPTSPLKRASILVALALLAAGAARHAGAAETTAPSYANPPARVLWLDGEDCTDHNWTGPMRNCWVYEYVPVHGGVLDLASWRLPPEGEYRARFEFNLAESGTYTLYYLGRVAGYLASPFTWQIDDGPEHREPEQGNSADSGASLDSPMNWKYAVTRLGDFTAGPGAHSVVIRVREPGEDRGLKYYSQQIDAILVSKAGEPVAGAPPPTPESAASPPHGVTDRDGKPPVDVTAGDLSLALSPAHGGIRRLQLGAPPAQGAVLDVARALPPLTVTFLSDSRETADAVEWQAHGDAWECRQTGARFDAVLRFTPDPGQDEVRIDATVTNRADEPIYTVRLLDLAGLALRGDSADDAYRVGYRTYEAGDEALRGFNRQTSPQFAFDWVCVSDDAMTFHARIEDEALLDTAVQHGRGRLAFEKFPRIEPGCTWQAPPIVLGAYSSGDWHPAADRFSAWWHGWARRPLVPDWVKSAGGLTLCYNLIDADLQRSAEVRQGDLDALRRNRDEFGIHFAHTCSWLVHPYLTEAWFPQSYRLDFAHLQEFRASTDALRAAGGRVSAYTNPLMFSRVIPAFELYGRDLAAVGQDGSIWLTEHTHRHHPMSLPYPSLAWARRYVEFVEEAVVMGRPDCLYMDQLGAIPSHLDFACEAHGHEHYGEWVAGSTRFVAEVLGRLRTGHPDLAAIIECPCPAIQQHVTLGLLGGNHILQYVFPYYPNAHGNYGACGPEEGLEHARESFRCCMLALLDRGTVEAMDDAARAEVRALIALKQAVDPLLYEARFRDTVGLSVLSGGVRGAVFQCDTAPALFVAVLNPDRAAPAAVALDLPAYNRPGPVSCSVMSSAGPGEWASVAVEVDGAMLRLPVPAEAACVFRIE